MIEHTARSPEVSLSLPIRMEKKRKRMQVGVACVVASTGILGAAGYNFTYSGSLLIATYLTVFGICLFGTGIFHIRRATV